ncbi:MAG TPA: DUF167 domain-containing protein [Rectinemataceae bacterium]|nr:DUF167 domain-containing protein [Rectinemataceae bacterium]
MGAGSPWREDPKDPAFLLLLVKVIPGASKTGASGIRLTADGPALLMRVAAAPEKGKANEELVAWLSEGLGLPRSALYLRSGASSRLKLLALPSSCRERLAALVP